MLVKEGHKGSYLLWGIVQIVLSIVLIALLVPSMLLSLGIDTSVWLEITTKILSGTIGQIIFGVLQSLPIVLFVICVLSLFFRRSGASLFIKLSAATAIFTFACQGLENAVFVLAGKNIDIMSIFSGGLVYVLFVASIVLLILGFVFQFTISKNNENKSNVYQIAKTILWIVLLVLNYIIPSILNASNWLLYLLGSKNLYPYYLCWYFLIMGIFQLTASPQLINPQDSNFSTGTQLPPQGVMPIAYIPVQPVMVDPFTPVSPNNVALKGRRQGLENGETEEQTTPQTETITQGLVEPEQQNETSLQEQEQPVSQPQETHIAEEAEPKMQEIQQQEPQEQEPEQEQPIVAIQEVSTDQDTPAPKKTNTKEATEENKVEKQKKSLTDLKLKTSKTKTASSSKKSIPKAPPMPESLKQKLKNKKTEE